MRYLTITALAVALSLLTGCLFSPAKTSPPAAQFLTITELGLSYNVTVSASVPFDLVVSGTNGTVTVAPHQHIRNLTISGQDSDVFIGSTTTVSGVVTLSGMYAILHLPAGSTIAVSVTGLGAMVVYDSSAG